jgi:signal transduction histidine kinase
MNVTHSPHAVFSRWGLKGKLILSMLLVGVVPLVVGLIMAFLQGSREIREVSGESFQALATEASRKLDLLVAEEVARTSRITVEPTVVRELEKRRDALQQLPEHASITALAEQKARWDAKDPGLIKAITDSQLARLLREYYVGSHGEPDQLLPQVVRAATKMLFITDAQGTLVAALTANPSFTNGDSAWWKGTFNKGVGQLYIEDVYFEEKAGAYTFSISLPIMDSLRYEVVGVLHRLIDAKEFFSPSTHPIRFGKTGHVMLIDSRGIVMSCPILPTGVRLADASLIPLVTLLYPGWVSAPSDGHGGLGTSIIGFAPLPETSRATNGSIDAGAWHTFVWQSSDELLAPVRHLFTWLLIFGSVAIGLLVTLGYLAASRIVTPVRQLQRAARSIGRGELREPIRITTGDELEDLAEEFNRMNSQLEAAFAGLNDQVNLKTQEVRYLQQSTSQILDAVPTPVIMVDLAEQVQYVNRATKEAFHLVDQNAPPASLFDLLPLEPSSRDKLRRVVGTHGNGSGQTAGPSSKDPVGGEAEPRDPLAPTAQASQLEGRELQIGPKTYRYEWFRVSSRPGEAERIGIVLRDATDDSRLQEQLIQEEKSGSLGVLTAGIGHELNNPLFGILGLGEAIQEEGDLSRVKSYAKDIVEHGRRMAATIRDFTGVAARGAKDQRVPVDLNVQLDQALAIVQASYDNLRTEVRKEYEAVPKVSALPEELRQVFLNVLVNAVQAMGGGGTLTLRTSARAGTATVTIQDSGPGIPRQHMTKIFDPFFTTKGQGEGSGLGLTIARRLARKFAGDVRIESQEGQGTTCFITLSTANATAPKEEPCTT